LGFWSFEFVSDFVLRISDLGFENMHIRIELWMWLGNELGGGFQTLSEMRSFREMEAEEGLTLIQLLDRLAAQSSLIEEKVFDRKSRRLLPHLSVVVTQDGLAVSPFDVEKSALKDGYRITVLPIYVGG